MAQPTAFSEEGCFSFTASCAVLVLTPWPIYGSNSPPSESDGGELLPYIGQGVKTTTAGDAVKERQPSSESAVGGAAPAPAEILKANTQAPGKLLQANTPAPGKTKA